MSSSLLPMLQAQAALYGMTTLMVLWITSNAFIIILFFKNRQNPCSLCLLSTAIFNIIVLGYNVPTHVVTYAQSDLTLRQWCLLSYFTYNIHFNKRDKERERVEHRTEQQKRDENEKNKSTQIKISSRECYHCRYTIQVSLFSLCFDSFYGIVWMISHCDSTLN